jgi:hypothetical protein
MNSELTSCVSGLFLVADEEATAEKWIERDAAARHHKRALSRSRTRHVFTPITAAAALNEHCALRALKSLTKHTARSSSSSSLGSGINAPP